MESFKVTQSYQQRAACYNSRQRFSVPFGISLTLLPLWGIKCSKIQKGGMDTRFKAKHAKNECYYNFEC